LADDRFREHVASGALVTVLEEFSTPFPGFYLNYPQRRQASAALRALVDYLRGEHRNERRVPRARRR
jgi:DNA-binding transcriptional LysR family regulator